ncbi:hypothetical protein [Lactobacillus hominis]|uniref:hypothetical protein n=1 Tax=Lactobacillus hominis TaxID=1203033 RepID=UPI0026F0BBF6|nr:hypothetical protein [Lactobacillus hominis]
MMQDDFYCISHSLCKYYRYTNQKKNKSFLSECDLLISTRLLEAYLKNGIVKTNLLNICNHWIEENTNTQKIDLEKLISLSQDIPCIITGNIKDIPSDKSLEIYLPDNYSFDHTMFGVFSSKIKKIVVKDDSYFLSKKNTTYLLDIQSNKFSYKYSILNSKVVSPNFKTIRNIIISNGIEAIPKFWKEFIVLVDDLNVTLAKDLFVSLTDSGFSSARYIMLELIEKYDTKQNKIIYEKFYSDFKKSLFYLRVQLLEFIALNAYSQNSLRKKRAIKILKKLAYNLLDLESNCLFMLQ